MKRTVLVPSAERYVVVESGTVRDLDGTRLGRVACEWGWWLFCLAAMDSEAGGDYPSQADALAALLADPSCPVPGPNRYDRHLTAPIKES